MDPTALLNAQCKLLKDDGFLVREARVIDPHSHSVPGSLYTKFVFDEIPLTFTLSIQLWVPALFKEPTAVVVPACVDHEVSLAPEFSPGAKSAFASFEAAVRQGYEKFGCWIPMFFTDEPNYEREYFGPGVTICQSNFSFREGEDLLADYSKLIGALAVFVAVSKTK